MQLTERTVLVTGATSGIGLGIAHELHRRGNQVIITGRRAARLRAIAGDHPGMTAMELDVGDTQAVDLVCGRIVADFPTLDLVVANAGVSKQESLTSDPVDLDAHDEIVSTNITGAVRTVSRLLRTLQTQPDATVIVTTSVLGFVPLASSPTYCAFKAFLHSWCESARHQLGPAGVDVIELVPPYVRTALTGADQEIDPQAMPLDDYLTEVFAILDAPGGLPPETWSSGQKSSATLRVTVSTATSSSCGTQASRTRTRTRVGPLPEQGKQQGIHHPHREVFIDTETERRHALERQRREHVADQVNVDGRRNDAGSYRLIDHLAKEGRERFPERSTSSVAELWMPGHGGDKSGQHRLGPRVLLERPSARDQVMAQRPSVRRCGSCDEVTDSFDHELGLVLPAAVDRAAPHAGLCGDRFE